MSDRKEFFVGELVTDTAVNQAFDQVEAADRALVADSATYGIIEGLAVAQHSGTPNLTVDVTLGTAYATAGERMRVGGNTNLDCSVDRDGISTTVTVNVNSRIVSVILRPDRVLSDPQQDATSTTVYFQRTESYALEVIQGSEATIPVAPTIPAGSILVADIIRTYGQTQILNASISAGSLISHRRQDVYVLTGTPLNVRAGKPKAAMQAIVARYNDHVNGLADPHDAGGVDYLGSGSWADAGAGLPAGPLDEALDAVPATLGSTSSLNSGVRKIGAEAHTLGGVTISSGTLYSWLTSLRVAGNIIYNGSGTWADSSSGLAAADLETTIDSLVSTLAATTAAAKLGMAAVGSFANGTIQGGFAALTSTSTSSDGSRLIGVQSQASQWSSGTLLSVLQWLGTAQAKTWTAQQTIGGGNWLFYDSRTVDIGHALSAPTSFSAAADVTIEPSDLSTTLPSGLIPVAPNVITTATGVAGHFHIQPLDRLLNGNTLASVKLVTKISVSADSGMVLPIYEVIRWKVTAGGGLTTESLDSTGAQTDDHTVGSNSTTIRLQTINLDQNNVIDTSVWNYGIMVQHPHSAISGDARLRIYSVVTSYTFTKGQPA